MRGRASSDRHPTAPSSAKSTGTATIWARFGYFSSTGYPTMPAERSEWRRVGATSAASPTQMPRKPPFGEPRSSEEPPALERRRAHERARGRHAVHPLQIPWLGWKDILWRTGREMQSDRLFSIAAGVAFYVLLAIFPAITALVSGYGLFFNA